MTRCPADKDPGDVAGILLHHDFSSRTSEFSGQGAMPVFQGAKHVDAVGPQLAARFRQEGHPKGHAVPGHSQRRFSDELPPNRNRGLRHSFWNGYHDEARRELYGMRHMASDVVYLNGERFRSPIGKHLWNCDDLWRDLTNNVDALINYGARYRPKLPISTLRAEGCVDEIANARMSKKPRMRWSPRGAHGVATVRAAILDGRLKTGANLRPRPDQNFPAPGDGADRSSLLRRPG